MQPVFVVNLARAAFVAICCLLGIALALSFQGQPWIGALGGTAFGLLMVGVDLLLKNMSIRGFSSGTFGLMIGILCAWLITRIGIFENNWMRSLENYDEIRHLAELMLYISLGFLGITMAVRSDREEFSLIIPYVRFRREGSYDQPLLLDTNVIIDGRIEAIHRTGFLGGTLILPQFVLDELHLLADSHDSAKGERGRAGLESLKALQNSTPPVEVVIYPDSPLGPGEQVDKRIVGLARLLGARILTNDVNLGRVASLQKVKVLNINDLARALHPTLVTGDVLTLPLSKKGREDHQAVGYLSDGTMIVVNNGISQLGEEAPVRVTSALQTTAGRLVFAELAEDGDEDGEMSTLPRAYFHFQARPEGHGWSVRLHHARGVRPLDGGLKRLPWTEIGAVVVEDSIGATEQRDILRSRVANAPSAFDLVLHQSPGDHRPLDPVSDFDHAVVVSREGWRPEPSDHRVRAIDSQDDLASAVEALLELEERSVLWVDPNMIASSPSTRHLLSSVPRLREGGWTIRTWGHLSEIPEREAEHHQLPRPWMPGPLRLFYIMSFGPIARHALRVYRRRKGRPPAAIVHGIGSFLERADIISFHYHIGEWGRIYKTLDDLTLLEKVRRPLELVDRVVERRVLKGGEVGEFWPVSRSVGQLLIKDGVPKKRVRVFSNSFDDARFNPETRDRFRAKAREELGYPDSATVFSFAGFGHFARKGLYLAVDALVELASRDGCAGASLLVVGGNEAATSTARSRIRQRHGEAGLALVRFVGMTDRPEFFFAASDAFLFPSFFETYALVAIEAAAMGIPLFLTPYHGQEMYLREGVNGRLLPWDAGSIADILEEEMRQGFSRYRREIGEGLSRSAYAEELLARYEAWIG